MGEMGRHPVRVAVVGTGTIGATFAYALTLSGLASEIVLINRDRDDAEGEAMDLSHAVPFGQATRIWAGDYADCAGAAVSVLTAGVPKGDNDSRLDLVEQNGAIVRQIVPQIVRHNPDGILLIASNPVDVLTYAALKISGFAPERVIGSGTVLDTARFRALIGQHVGIDPRNVNAVVIGEHGDSEVPVWSRADIAGMPIPDYCAAAGVPYDRATMDALFRETRDAGAEVAKRKGGTAYGIASSLVRVVEAILRDQRTVLEVSSLIVGYDEGVDGICLSLPAIVGRGGVERVLHPTLSPEELAGLRRSAAILKESVARLDLGPVATAG